MSGVTLLNVLDVARSLGSQPLRATPNQVADWLLSEYLKRRGGGFNYDPAIGAVYDLFRGACSEDQAILHCMASGNPKGRGQNISAVKCISSYALQNKSTCYRIRFRALPVGRVKSQTIYVGIKAPMIRVRDGEVLVVMPGFRMSHRPAEPEIDTACSIALANFGRDDFADADFEYLYAGPGVDGRIREFRSIRGKGRNILAASEIDAVLQTYVEGVALAIEAGAENKAPRLDQYYVADDRQQMMF
jgi:hypothetical protein